MHFYIIPNINNNTPYPGVPYVHLKCKGDNSATAIMTRDPVDDLPELTQEEVKAELDSWLYTEHDEAITWWQYFRSFTPFPDQEAPERQYFNIDAFVTLADKARWIYG